MNERTILTFAAGAATYRTMAKALAISLDLHGSMTPRTIFTDSVDDAEVRALFGSVLAPPEDYNHWFMKLAGLDHTPYDEILYLDGDGLAVRNVDPIFNELKGSDFAVQGEWLHKPGEWYGDIESVMKREGIEAIPKFSGGFLFYERTDRARELIRTIMDYASKYDQLGLARNGGKVVDEVCIALAMAKTKIGTVISDSCHSSTTPWRKVGPLRLDVIGGQCSFMRVMPESGLELVRPAIYHTAMAKWDLPYWREVRRLLSAFRTKTAPEMTNSTWIRLRRKVRRVAVEIYKGATIRD